MLGGSHAEFAEPQSFENRDARTRISGMEYQKLNETTGIIVDCSMKIHAKLGPGLLESVYEAILCRDLTRRGLDVVRQKVLRFEYDGMVFDEGLRIDLIVNDHVVIELKSVESLNPVHKKQLLTYLRLSNNPLGLLINFGEMSLKNGVHRIANNLKEHSV